MSGIKAIETTYNGYRFRSRLEARWAVFFDSLRIPYVYEPEGVDLGNGVLYLPDFYLPDCKQFFEVKGVLTDKDEDKIKRLVNKGYSVTIGYDNGQFSACDNWGAKKFGFPDNGSDNWLCQCIKCGKYWFMQCNGYYSCQCCDYYDGDSGFHIIMSDHDTKAWDVARKARFEHGETPQLRDLPFC